MAFHFGHPLIMDGLRPVSPNFQFLGMMNCKKAEPLTRDLQDFFNSAGSDGVIYVSFGSVVKTSEMPIEKRKMFLNVFKSLKQKILWKWESEEMDDLPPNVKLSKWLPQQDVLSQGKLRLFITHGGQSSAQETLCHRKPALFTPVFADQFSNAREAEKVGFGISIPYLSLTEDNLKEAINAMLTDNRYKEKAIEHGNLLTDQITAPLDRAVWWIEFLIRHPGKNHMRSPVHDLTWYQYYLLDVLGVILCTIIIIIIVIVKVMKFVIRLLMQKLSKVKSD